MMRLSTFPLSLLFLLSCPAWGLGVGVDITTEALGASDQLHALLTGTLGQAIGCMAMVLGTLIGITRGSVGPALVGIAFSAMLMNIGTVLEDASLNLPAQRHVEAPGLNGSPGSAPAQTGDVPWVSGGF